MTSFSLTCKISRGGGPFSTNQRKRKNELWQAQIPCWHISHSAQHHLEAGCFSPCQSGEGKWWNQYSVNEKHQRPTSLFLLHISTETALKRNSKNYTTCLRCSTWRYGAFTTWAYLISDKMVPLPSFVHGHRF